MIISPPPVSARGQKAAGGIFMNRLNEEDEDGLGACLQSDLAGLCLGYKEAGD